jgi:hypothetical protein
MVVGDNGIDGDEKCREIAGDFDHHADAVVQCVAHHPMEHILGFTRSHWMLPLGEYLRRITTAAAMVDNFFVEHKTLTKQNTTFC